MRDYGGWLMTVCLVMMECLMALVPPTRPQHEAGPSHRNVSSHPAAEGVTCTQKEALTRRRSPSCPLVVVLPLVLYPAPEAGAWVAPGT